MTHPDVTAWAGRHFARSAERRNKTVRPTRDVQGQEPSWSSTARQLDLALPTLGAAAATGGQLSFTPAFRIARGDQLELARRIESKHFRRFEGVNSGGLTVRVQ